MYLCIFIRMLCYVSPPRCFVSWAPNAQGSSTVLGSVRQFNFFRNSLSYYLFYDQSNYPLHLLRTFAGNAMSTTTNNRSQLSFVRFSEVTKHKGEMSLDVTITGSITLQFGELQEAIKILPGSTRHQGMYGYVCVTVVYLEIW